MTRRWAIHVGALALVAAAAASGTTGAAQSSAPASPTAASADVRRHVEFLASDALEGRLTGTPGADAAASYLEAELRKLGAQPLPGRSSLRTTFEYTAGLKDDGTTLAVEGTAGAHTWSAASGHAVRALSFSDSREVKGGIVFAGYGLVVPEGQDVSYNSYVGLDVKDKIVLVLRYFPEDVDGQMRAGLARYSGLRYKAMAARERGAVGLLVVTGPRSPGAGELAPMTFDTALAGSGVAAASVSGEVAATLFTGASGKTLEQSQKDLDTGNPHIAGFEIPGVAATLNAKVRRETRTTDNVVGYLPPSNGGPASSAGKTLVAIGAHYDHLGKGANGSSLARKEEAGGIHHGADDNASGVSATLLAARWLAAKERRRGVVVAFWSGEELGLLGSSAFSTSQKALVDRLAAYLNFDMVGRMVDNKLTVQAVGSSGVWPKLLEQANVAAGFDLALQADPYLPTDSAAFNQVEVPTLNFFTGSHEDYHRPSDVATKINVDDLARVAEFGATLAWRVANADEAPAFVKVAQTTQSGGSRDAVRIFTGTIPDYTGQAEGLLLGGVIGGGPADQAGLQKGDVIVEIAGKKIANIYDYTYMLDALKVDVPVTVVFVRGGERKEVTLTPRARK
ncbi:MAG: M20/M25/M40 family metallo-hydrolase [Vicinamibacterales bacterium]